MTALAFALVIGIHTLLWSAVGFEQFRAAGVFSLDLSFCNEL